MGLHGRTPTDRVTVLRAATDLIVAGMAAPEPVWREAVDRLDHAIHRYPGVIPASGAGVPVAVPDAPPGGHPVEQPEPGPSDDPAEQPPDDSGGLDRDFGFACPADPDGQHFVGCGCET